MLRLKSLVALIGLTIGFQAAFAQSAVDAVRILDNELGFGARALGMGGAYTGLADDYSAIYWNPAGLALMQDSEFYGEVSHLNFQNEASFAGNLTEDTGNFTHLRSLGYAFPIPTTRGSFVLGIGYNRVKDFDQNLLFSGFNDQSNGISFNIDSMDYAFDRNVLQQEQIIDEGGLDQWSVGFGIALSPNVTAGVSAYAWNGNSDYELRFRQEDVDDNFNQFPGDFESYTVFQAISANYSGAGLKLGIMAETAPGLKLGATIALPTTFTVDEIYAEDDELVFDDGQIDTYEAPVGEFRYEVKTPFYFDGGLSYSNQQFTVGGSFRYRDWAKTRFNVEDEDLFDNDYRDLLDENQFIRQDYRATMEYRVGGEVLLPGLNSSVRLGYAYLPNPLDNLDGDFDRKYLTAGATFMVDDYVSLNIGFVRGNWKQESEDVFTPGGTLEDIKTNKFLLGLGYRF